MKRDLDMTFWRRWTRQTLPDQWTSVILKRQIPVRAEEDARSWLGGLPMMPKNTRWPRDPDGNPLQFVAQIACADLPQKLWNGQGPRRGWLLLFVEYLNFEEFEARRGAVQVLHTAELGIEHEPPQDLATVRHVMGDYIGAFGATIRPGVPKLWRKWPIDLVTNEHQMSDAPTPFSAEALYGAPVSEYSMRVHVDIGLKRPLTWRGALYVVEGVAEEISDKEVDRHLANIGALLAPPELDREGFDEEFQRRLAEMKVFEDREVGWGLRVDAAKAALTAKMAVERSVGWIGRGFVAQERMRAKFQETRDRYRRSLNNLIEGVDVPSEDVSLGPGYFEAVAQDYESRLQDLQEARARLIEIQDAYPGPEGEVRLNAEIRSLGEAHRALIPGLRTYLTRLMDHILAQDLEAPLPEPEWRKIQEGIEDFKSVCWRSVSNSVPEKVELRVVDRYRRLDMAIREDILDIYVRGDKRHPELSGAFLENVEMRLRHSDDPHRMGGFAPPEQDESNFEALLFQIDSDAAMGWCWHDARTLFVTISPRALSRSRFGEVHAWISH